MKSAASVGWIGVWVAAWWCGLHSAASAQPERSAPLETSPELTRRLQELRPDIEQALGWSLRDDVEVVVVDIAGMRRVLVEEAVIRTAWRLPKASLKAVRRGESLKVGALAFAVLGKVELARNRIVINLEVVDSMADIGDQRSLVWTQDFIDVLLAHEVTHVAQADRYPLSELYFGRAQPEWVGLASVVEGQAQYAAQEFARKRNLLDVLEAYTGLHTGKTLQAPEMLKPFLEALSQASSFAYLSGERFYRAAAEMYGPDKAGALLFESEFPKQAEVLDPNAYFSRAKPQRVPAPARPLRTIRIALEHREGVPVQAPATLHVWGDGPNFEAAVARGVTGSLEVRVPEGAMLRCGAVETAGVEWDVVLGELLTANEDGSFRVRVGGEPQATLRIEDALTGEPLAGATVWGSPAGFARWSGERIELTGTEWGHETSDASGVVPAPPRNDSPPDGDEIWVQCPGYATEIRRRPPGTEIDRVIRLHRGAGIRLDWSRRGRGALKDLRLERVPFQYETIPPIVSEMPEANAVPLAPPFEISNLLPGRYRVTALYRGAPYSAGRTREFTLEPRRMARWEIPSDPPVAAGSIELEFRVPEAWPIPAVRGFRWDFVDDDIPSYTEPETLPTPVVENGMRVHRVTVTPAELGTYGFALFPAGHWDAVEVEESTRKLVLTVPPPITLRVQVVHADGSEILEPVSIFVQPCDEDEGDEPLFEDGSDIAQMQGTEWADPRGAEFVRAPGRHLISVVDGEGRTAHRAVTLTAPKEGEPSHPAVVTLSLDR